MAAGLKNGWSFFLPMTSVTALVLVGTLFLAGARADGPMPYTNDAVAKVNEAMGRSKVPEDTSEGNDVKVRLYVAARKKAFSAAGFDYEQSLKKIVNDIQFDRYVVNKATITLNKLARELVKLHVDTGIDPHRYLSRDFADLLLDFRDLLRKNAKYGGC